MKLYLQRLAELAAAGFLAGVGQYVVANGFELSQAAVQGAGTAGAAAVLGLLAKKFGDKDKPGIVK